MRAYQPLEDNQAVAAAATEAAIAENALAVAQGRAAEAGTASAAATKTLVGGTGVGLIALAITAAGAEGAFKALQATVDDSGALDRYAQSITKTKDQLKDLTEKVGGFQITWGDVFHGLGKAAGDALGASSIWDAFKEGNKSAFTGALHNAVDFAAKSYGVVRGSYQTIVDDWSKFPAIIGDAFYSAVNVAIGALNKLVKFGTDQLNALITSANKLPFVNLGKVSAPQIGAVGNPYAGAKLDSAGANIDKFTNEARSRINSGLSKIYGDIVGEAEKRIKGDLPKDKKGRHPREKKENDHGLGEALAKLDAEIKGQYALAAAYQVSGAAAQRAEAQQKAAEDAISHKGGLDQFYALELQKIVATDVAKQAKANEGLQLETSLRARLNGQIADGSLTIAEVKAPHARLYVLLGLFTMARPSAILDLTWSRVDFEREQIDLNPAGRRQTKKRRPVVPLNTELLEALREADNGRQSEFVIERGGKQIASMKKAFQAASVRSGIHATPYTLRHTGAVWAAEAGVPMAELAQFMGHDDDSTTQTHYARYSPDFLKGVANKVRRTAK